MSVDPRLQTAREQAQAAVDALYQHRDRFVELHGIDKAAARQQILLDQTKTALAAIDPLLASYKSDATLVFLRGKALNVTETYTKEAEDALAKAVKLAPDMIAAWNELGECYFKKRDLQASHNCFLGALQKQKNKVSLRNLSMLLRQLPGDEAARRKNIAESVAVAKDAVSLDYKDGHSWFVLGNAYLALFFSSMTTAEHIRMAIKAFRQAELDPRELANNPDLHYNRAVIFKYQEDFQAAIAGFEMAAKLEPANKEPLAQVTAIREFVARIADGVEHKGRMKPKRISALVEAAVKASGSNASFRTLDGLKPGINNGVALQGVVVSSVSEPGSTTQAFVCVDGKEQCFCVTVYNMIDGAIKTEDTLVVPEPLLQHVQLPLEAGKTAAYLSVRVDNPVTLVLNNMPLGDAKLAKSQLQCTIKAD
eukprot:m.85510 g.85510  ORF g.85510 m.85510 type:complete len:423 (-) comp15057_c0_seq1:231-1499(-)